MPWPGRWPRVQSTEILTEAAFSEGKETLTVLTSDWNKRWSHCLSRSEKSGLARQNLNLAISLLPEWSGKVGPSRCWPETILCDTSIEGAEKACPKMPVELWLFPLFNDHAKNCTPGFNIVIMGAVIGPPMVTIEWPEALEAKLGGKFKQNPALREMNFKALEIGAEMVKTN